MLTNLADFQLLIKLLTSVNKICTNYKGYTKIIEISTAHFPYPA